jgi:hypothetical protein
MDGITHCGGVLTPNSCFSTTTICSTENRFRFIWAEFSFVGFCRKLALRLLAFGEPIHGKVESTLRYLLGAGQNSR